MLDAPVLSVSNGAVRGVRAGESDRWHGRCARDGAGVRLRHTGRPRLDPTVVRNSLTALCEEMTSLGTLQRLLPASEPLAETAS